MVNITYLCLSRDEFLAYLFSLSFKMIHIKVSFLQLGGLSILYQFDLSNMFVHSPQCSVHAQKLLPPGEGLLVGVRPGHKAPDLRLDLLDLVCQPVQQDLGVVLPPGCAAAPPHLAAQLVQLAPELPHVTGDVSALLRHHETGEQHEGDTGPGHALTDYNTLSRSPGSVPPTGAHLPGAALCPTAPPASHLCHPSNSVGERKYIDLYRFNN